MSIGLLAPRAGIDVIKRFNGRALVLFNKMSLGQRTRAEGVVDRLYDVYHVRTRAGTAFTLRGLLPGADSISLSRDATSLAVDAWHQQHNNKKVCVALSHAVMSHVEGVHCHLTARLADCVRWQQSRLPSRCVVSMRRKDGTLEACDVLFIARVNVHVGAGEPPRYEDVAAVQFWSPVHPRGDGTELRRHPMVPGLPYLYLGAMVSLVSPADFVSPAMLVPNLYPPGKREGGAAAATGRTVNREAGFVPDGEGTQTLVFRCNFFWHCFPMPDVGYEPSDDVAVDDAL
jgi:hypothetical protein